MSKNVKKLWGIGNNDPVGMFFSIQNDPLSKVNMVMSEKQSGDCPQILPQVKVTTRQSVEFMVDSK